MTKKGRCLEATVPVRELATVRAEERRAHVGFGSWLCENEIRFGRNAERKTNFCVFLLSASPVGVFQAAQQAHAAIAWMAVL
jgi:hypothetical protein